MIIEIKIPDIGVDETEVTEILVSVGDKVEIEQSLITVEGNKTSMEIPAPFSGIVKEIKINIGDKVHTGSPIMQFEIEEISKSADINQNIACNSNDVIRNRYRYVHATPVIRRLAREFNINLEQITGTGRKGRILREDIHNYLKKMTVNDNDFLPDRSPLPQVDFRKFGDTEEVELNRIQKISGANLHRSWMTIPHVTQFDEVDITEMESFRKQQNAEAEKKNLVIKITPLTFIMKATSKALEEFPRFNSSLSEKNQKLILKKYINIGVAVNTPSGLIVPVLRHVNKKGIIELSREIAALSKKARTNKLISSDMHGGCFTISSLGSIGGIAFTPIINAPEVAILGVSKSSMKLVWNGKEFAPRLMLPLSLSYDHRVIDGVDGAYFINFINNMMSDIRRLMM